MIILHILLGILKWLGILLLALLCILLTLLLIILLVPIRYRAEVEKRTESFADVKVLARVSWLLSMVSFSFIREGGTNSMVLHIFGHSPEEYKNFIKKLKRKKEKPANASVSEPVEAVLSAISENPANSAPVSTEPADSIKPADVEASPENEKPALIEDKTTAEEVPDQAVISSLLDKIQDRFLALKEKLQKEEQDEPMDVQPQVEEEKEKLSLKERLSTMAENLILSAGAFLRPIFVKIGHILVKIPTYFGLGVMYVIKYSLYLGMAILGAPFISLGIPDIIREKFADIAAKADKILDFLKTKDGKRLIRLLMKELVVILKKIIPRRLEGDLVVGFNDPSLIGEIYGGLVMVKALRGRKFLKDFSFEPDFEQNRIEGMIRLDGHIRLGSFVLIALRLIIDPCVWKTIKLVKNL